MPDDLLRTPTRRSSGVVKISARIGQDRASHPAGPASPARGGRRLYPTAQEFSYGGDTYTIMSVNPGADSFTVFKGGLLFVIKGTAITGGTGVMCCTR